MKLDLPHRFCRVFLSGLILLAVLRCNAHAQSAGQSESKSRAVYRLALTECEGVDNCTAWSFLSSNGWKGYGKWRTGEEAVLELESPETGKVIIHRTDVRGTKEGLIATYEGTLSDDQMGGRYTYSYKGDTGSGRWYAILGAPAPKLPAVMHFCDVNCTTLQWEDGRYVSKTSNGFEDPNWSDTWTVESFTSGSVVFNRKVTGKFHFKVTYRGQISDDGNSLINAANPFHGEGQPTNILLAWGDALNSVPGSNAERDGARGFQQTPSRQITAGEVYEGARTARDFVLEIKKWHDFWNIFFPPESN
jgi:hypothetical protein